jgi:hypothetical protein
MENDKTTVSPKRRRSTGPLMAHSYGGKKERIG